MLLSWSCDRIRSQELRYSLFEGCLGDDLPSFQIFKLSFSKVLPQLCPHSLDGIEVTTVGWEIEGLQPSFLVFLWCLYELLVVMPHLELLDSTTLAFEAHGWHNHAACLQDCQTHDCAIDGVCNH